MRPTAEPEQEALLGVGIGGLRRQQPEHADHETNRCEKALAADHSSRLVAPQFPEANYISRLPETDRVFPLQWRQRRGAPHPPAAVPFNPAPAMPDGLAFSDAQLMLSG